jgi:hypothetical protein
MTSRSIEYVDYKQRVLLFCDVLGWASFIEDTQHESYYRDNISLLLDEVWRHTEITQQIKSAGQTIDFDLTIGHFSDTIVYSCTCSPTSISLLVRHAAHITNKFLEKSFLCRGAIVTGPLIHQGPVIFGPALVQAHRMESEVAVYPRILVAREVVSQIKDSGALRHDPDGHSAVDTFGITWRRTNEDVDWNRANLTPISEHIARELRKHKPNDKVHSKWLYIARAFNSFVTLHPELKLSQIGDG